MKKQTEDHMGKWVRVEDRLPEEGVLCIVYFPIGEHTITMDTVGEIAIAYYRPNGQYWIRADTPTPLRWKPFYWMPFDTKLLNQKILEPGSKRKYKMRREYTRLPIETEEILP